MSYLLFIIFFTISSNWGVWCLAIMSDNLSGDMPFGVPSVFQPPRDHREKKDSLCVSKDVSSGFLMLDGRGIGPYSCMHPFSSGGLHHHVTWTYPLCMLRWGTGWYFTFTTCVKFNYQRIRTHVVLSRRTSLTITAILFITVWIMSFGWKVLRSTGANTDNGITYALACARWVTIMVTE